MVDITIYRTSRRRKPLSDSCPLIRVTLLLSWLRINTLRKSTTTSPLLEPTSCYLPTLPPPYNADWMLS